MTGLKLRIAILILSVLSFFIIDLYRIFLMEYIIKTE